MTDTNKWQVLVVDDEESVHSVTKLALTGFSYQGKGVEFTHAYSGAEARRTLLNGGQFAVVLLDVVMETDDAGLEVCNFIRNEIQDKKVRILLRTGNPGQAPEQDVIMNYEINDYIEKTDLTMGRLINHMVVALRGYRDLCALQGTRDGYREMVDATGQMEAGEVPGRFIKGALRQLAALLYLDAHPSIPHRFALGKVEEDKVHLLGVMSVDEAEDDVEGTEPPLTGEQMDIIREAMTSKQSTNRDGYYVARTEMESGSVYLLFLSTGDQALAESDRELVNLFCARLGRFVERSTA